LKYDPNVKQSRGIERTQRAFATAMFDSLAQKPFDKITVNGLCQKADYPRATFYNYFDDKFDLLNFCWFKLGQDTHLDVSDTQKGKLTIKETFAQIYKLFKDQQSLLLSIIENNPIDSPLVNHFVRHFTDVIYASVKKMLMLKIPTLHQS
jgi:Transcriptional regulator